MTTQKLLFNLKTLLRYHPGPWLRNPGTEDEIDFKETIKETIQLLELVVKPEE